MFYAHALPQLNVIAEKTRNCKVISPSTIIRSNKIGRNSTCPCGSGKKYKYCCMRLVK